MEIFSNKSDKNVSLRNKNNTISYKSVSEIDEFEECVEAESSDFVIQTQKKDNKSQKLNESSHSDVISNFSKDIFDEKDEDKNS
jgi:hypothetical protein